MIVGAVGGFALLLMIIVFLCVMILCIIRCHKKEGKKVSCNTAQLNTDVSIENNPSYDVNSVRHSVVPITANPSYSDPTRPYSKISEDTYNYVQPNEFAQHSGLDRPIEMETNPSYGVRIGKEKSTALSTTSDTRTYQSSHDATAMEYDDDYASSDHVLHYTSNITAAKQDNHIDKSHNAKTSQSYYFTLVTNSAEPTGGDNK